MDPRRARDPRLARADPRLQQVPSGSPAPTPSPQQLGQQWSPMNGYDLAPSSQSPAQLSGYPLDGTGQSSLPLDSQIGPTPKERPLFCVVCASNQVGPLPFLNPRH